MSKKNETSCFSSCVEERRTLLKAALGIGVGLLGWKTSRILAWPGEHLPQQGDLLVHAVGDQYGTIVSMEDLSLGGPPVLAYPMDSRSKAIKAERMDSLILVLRFSLNELASNIRRHSADGVIAYSAICTHAGCPVNGWVTDKRLLQCPCHRGLFDPRQGGIVVSGPPPRRLALLPLRLERQNLIVAGKFIGIIGPLSRSA